MREALVLFSATFICSLVADSTPAAACDIAPPEELVIVSNPLDITAPATPTARLAGVDLGETGACVGHGDCRDLTRVEFELSSTDDVSRSSTLGYLFEPRDVPLYVGEGPVVANGAGRLSVYLNGADEAHGPDFDVRVFAVDGAGNVSHEPAVVTVRRSSEGCGVGRNAQRGLMWTLAALALTAWSQKKRRRSP